MLAGCLNATTRGLEGRCTSMTDNLMREAHHIDSTRLHQCELLIGLQRTADQLASLLRLRLGPQHGGILRIVALEKVERLRRAALLHEALHFLQIDPTRRGGTGRGEPTRW